MITPKAVKLRTPDGSNLKYSFPNMPTLHSHAASNLLTPFSHPIACSPLPLCTFDPLCRSENNARKVVIPNIRGFNLDTLDLNAGDPWPPSKGTFNWRLAYSPVMADIEKDMIPGFPLMASPVRTPVMPGGLFAMDKVRFGHFVVYCFVLILVLVRFFVLFFFCPVSNCVLTQWRLKALYVPICLYPYFLGSLGPRCFLRIDLSKLACINIAITHDAY